MKVEVALASNKLEFLNRRYRELNKEKEKVMAEYDEKIHKLFEEITAEEALMQTQSEDGYKFWLEVNGKKLTSVKTLSDARGFYPNPDATPEGAKIYAQFQLHKPVLVMERSTKSEFDHHRPGKLIWRWASKEVLMRWGSESNIHLRLGADAAKNKFYGKDNQNG
jgi:hypothetical protein